MITMMTMVIEMKIQLLLFGSADGAFKINSSLEDLKIQRKNIMCVIFLEQQDILSSTQLMRLLTTLYF
jgi:hypothetical protein